MESTKKKLGIIGCGNIGNEIAGAIDRGDIDVILHACFDLERAKYDALVSKLNNIKPVFMDVEELVKQSDLVVECAAKDAVKSVFSLAIKYNRDIMFLSAGGVIENMDLVEQARSRHINIYVPSGAVVGIDGLDAAKYRGLKQVTLITRKPPQAFKGNKYLEEKGVDIEKIVTETVVFDGSAREAVKGFPQNVNVAATLSIAGVGPDKTRVKIVIDPFISVNTHEILVEGDFGRFRVITENLPSPNNPKTSYLTSLSTIVTIKKIVEPIHIGT
ncbi:MAG: aspartate dehydrogenase [Spirochaetia bacterium]|nr:aspartate dehydrogenase [Spirochaetia bacterium]